MTRRARTIFAAIIATSAAAAGARADDTGFAYSHDLKKESGRTCFASHAHSGIGEAKTKDKAQAAALKSWYEYTAGEYGSDWARWGRSAGQSVSYTKTADGWSANISSRPCK
jgi:hypothetical protein